MIQRTICSFLANFTRNFQKAISEAEKARKLLAKVIDQSPDKPQLQRAAAALEGQALNLIVDADINVASLYMTRQSYSRALAAVNHAIAFDSGNQAARNMRARIELAASDDDFGGWGVARGF